MNQKLLEIHMLHERRAAVHSDAARLDWLSRQDLNDVSFSHIVDAPHDGEYAINVGSGPHYGKTLREAIDAAIRSEGN